MNYLTKRGSTYYFRRAIPDYLQEAFEGRKELVISLHTKDRGVAKRRAAADAVRSDILFDDARKRLGLACPDADTPPIAETPLLSQGRLLIGEMSAQPEDEGANGTVQRPMLDGAILSGWAAERKPRPKTFDSYKRTTEWFYERVGRKTVDKITKKDILLFKDRLISEGQTIENTIILLSRISTLLTWSSNNDYVEHNVASSVKLLPPKNRPPSRIPFDLESINRIFDSPIYTSGYRPKQGRGEAAFWLPLMGLLTGGRREEIGQLWAKDVREVRYFDGDDCEQFWWFISIRWDEAEGLKTKNTESIRFVPIHPALVELGFIDFVKDTSNAGRDRLFPELRPNKYDRVTQKWGEWFSVYIRTKCGVTDRRMVFHSFRHYFKDMARAARIEDGVQRRLMGHSGGIDAADAYGSGYPFHILVEAMKQIRFPGVVVAGRRLSRKA